MTTVPRRALCTLLIAIAAVLLAAPSAFAQGTITDSPASFVRGASPFDSSPDGNFTGVSPTLTQDHLFETGWAFRVSGDAAETFFPAPTLQSYSADTSTNTWGDVAARGLFSASEVSVVENTGRPSGYVTMAMSLTNLSAVNPLTIDVFHMVDFDVQPTAGNDAATLVPGTRHIRVTDAGTNFAGYDAAGADNYLVRAFGATDLGAVLSNAGVDNFADSGLPFGPGDLTAGWQWSTRVIAPSATAVFTARLAVNDASATTTAVTPTPNPSTVGGPVTLTATVTPASGPAANDGVVTFKDNGVDIGSPVPVVDGVATLTTSSLTAGTHPITAVYGGGQTLLGSTSASVDQVVEADADASMTGGCAPTTVSIGANLTCAVTIANAGPGPAQRLLYQVQLNPGTTFAAMTTPAGWSCSTPAAGAEGTVTCQKDLLAPGGSDALTLEITVGAGRPPGPMQVYAVLAAFSHDPDTDDIEVISPVTVVATTTTTVASSATPAVTGTAVTLTATVAEAADGSPTGTVQFRDGTADLGVPVVLSGGTAALTTSSLSVGSHEITAVYGGDASFVASTSPVFSQVITAVPAPGPGPAPAPGPGSGAANVSFAGAPRSVELSDAGAFALPFAATAGARGTLTVQATVPGKRKKGSKKRAKPRTVTLVSRSFTAGATGKVPNKIKLSKTALAKLPKSGKRFAAVLRVKIGAKTTTHRFTIVRAKPKKKAKPKA